ncbi:hypothetical protein TKK_0011096 [Trichogramma kaykai]
MAPTLKTWKKTSPSPATKKPKPRAYKKSWEQEPWAKGWLTQSRRTDIFKQAACTVCDCDLRAHMQDLKEHSDTMKHKNNMRKLLLPKITTALKVDGKQKQKERDVQLAVYVACHASISSVDHLCDILRSFNVETKLHRTKCSLLIKNVIAPNILLDLVKDVGEMPYSLIVDESTDVSTVKYMCVCIKYYSVKEKRFITDFLGLLEIEVAEGKVLYVILCEFLDKIKLPKKNLKGLGTDGGSNLCGKNKSLYALLKKDVPEVILIRCICHALNNAADTASTEFPRSVEYLCSEVYNR